MKIGILTLHRANNYGAALQCFALQEVLLSLGHEVYVIDYRQRDTELSYKAFCWKKIKPTLRNPRAFVKALLYIPYSLIQQRGFNGFRKQYLKCTSPVYFAKDMPQNFDYYVIGSDQLWSIQCMGGHYDPVFWGQFPHPVKSRIVGYAISGNIPSLLSIGIDRIKNSLSAFSCLSVRESGISDWIKKETGFPVRQDIDPTLLFDAKKWNEISGKRPQKSKYILMYFLLPEQKLQAYKFAQKVGLKLIEVGKVAFSPQQFLAYVKHAEYILGGSFHIAVFSIIFRKQFYIIKKNNEFDVRSEHLLRSLELRNRFIAISDLAQIELKNIDKTEFIKAESRLSALKQDSLNYLKSL